MDIPKPPPGYWRRIETGQKIKIPPLPSPKEKTLLRTWIYPHVEVEITDPQTAELLAFETQTENKITVPETLKDPHTLIAAYKAKREKRAAKKTRDVSDDLDETDDFLNIYVSDGSLERALRMMDAVLKALESRGYKIRVSKDYWEKATRVYPVDANVEVRISLKERYSKVERELTPEEKKKPPYLIDNRFSSIPNGKLVFTMDVPLSGKKWWVDKKLEPLEEILNDIVGSIVLNLESLRHEELRKREEERRKLEEQKCWAEEKRRREILDKEVASWNKSEQIRAYLKAYEAKLLQKQGEITHGSEEDLWLKWAYAYADAIDPLKQIE